MTGIMNQGKLVKNVNNTIISHESAQQRFWLFQADGEYAFLIFLADLSPVNNALEISHRANLELSDRRSTKLTKIIPIR